MGRLLPPWDDRYRGDPGRPAALGRQCGRTAYCLDASGRRRVVDLFRVPGRRSGGEQYLPREAAEACPCKGRARRAERLKREMDYGTQCLGQSDALHLPECKRCSSVTQAGGTANNANNANPAKINDPSNLVVGCGPAVADTAGSGFAATAPGLFA